MTNFWWEKSHAELLRLQIASKMMAMDVQGAHKWPGIQVIYGTSQMIHQADAVPTGSATL